MKGVVWGFETMTNLKKRTKQQHKKEKEKEKDGTHVTVITCVITYNNM